MGASADSYELARPFAALLSAAAGSPETPDVTASLAADLTWSANALLAASTSLLRDPLRSGWASAIFLTSSPIAFTASPALEMLAVDSGSPWIVAIWDLMSARASHTWLCAFSSGESPQAPRADAARVPQRASAARVRIRPSRRRSRRAPHGCEPRRRRRGWTG